MSDIGRFTVTGPGVWLASTVNAGAPVAASRVPTGLLRACGWDTPSTRATSAWFPLQLGVVQELDRPVTVRLVSGGSPLVIDTRHVGQPAAGAPQGALRTTDGGWAGCPGTSAWRADLGPAADLVVDGWLRLSQPARSVTPAGYLGLAWTAAVVDADHPDARIRPSDGATTCHAVTGRLDLRWLAGLFVLGPYRATGVGPDGRPGTSLCRAAPTG